MQDQSRTLTSLAEEFAADAETHRGSAERALRDLIRDAQDALDRISKPTDEEIDERTSRLFEGVEPGSVPEAEWQSARAKIAHASSPSVRQTVGGAVLNSQRFDDAERALVRFWDAAGVAATIAREATR